MQYEVEPIADRPITILKLVGELDASCYLEVIAKVQNLYDDGHHNLILDLSEMPFMASSGLVSLHSIALIMQGKTPLNPEQGWQALHAISNDVGDTNSTLQNCKLLFPQPRVAKTLKMTGFDNLFAQFSERKVAIQSFSE
ncbi:MAG: STAS domain-containing protein [Chloroflexota bacterium]